MLVVLGTALATNSTSTNLTAVTNSFGTFTDIFGGITAGDDIIIGLGLFAFFGILLLASGMNPLVVFILITPMVIVLSGATLGMLPVLASPLVLIVLGLIWGIIIIRMFGVR